MKQAELSSSLKWELDQSRQESQKSLRIARVRVLIQRLVSQKTVRLDVVRFAKQIADLLDEEYEDQDFNVDEMGDAWAAREVLKIRAEQIKAQLGFWSRFRKGSETVREFIRVVNSL